MKAVVFLCMVILVGFALLGRMTGDLESLRSQNRQLTTELQTARASLGGMQSQITNLQTQLAQLQQERDRAAVMIQGLRQTITDTIRERDDAQRRGEDLRLALANAIQERGHTASVVQQLQLSLGIAEHDRDQAQARVDELELQLQEAARELDITQVTAPSSAAASDVVSGTSGLAPWFTLVFIGILMGYSGTRSIQHIRHRRTTPSTMPAGDGTAADVWVRLPRAWTEDYAQWLRHRQSAAQARPPLGTARHSE